MKFAKSSDKHMPGAERASIAKQIQRFIWWCAGADVATLQACPTDQTRFTALGMMVLVAPCLASISFAFFLTQTFGLPTPLSVFAGVLWGFGVVFMLDRLILTFHRKGPGELGAALPRLIVAFAMALLISEPLLVRFFRSEIDLQLKLDAQSVVSEARVNAEARVSAERDQIRQANGEMRARLDHLKEIRDAKEEAVIAEIEGRVGSGILGDGPAADRKKEAFGEAKKAYEQARQELMSRIEENSQKLVQIQQTIDQEVAAVAASHRDAGGGMMKRHQALFAFIRHEPSAALTYVPLFIILLLTEVSPLLSKLVFRPGEYDLQLALRQKNAMQQARRLAALDRQKKKGQIKLKNTLHKRILGIVDGTQVSGNHRQENELADLIRSSALEEMRNDVLAERPLRQASRVFAPEVPISITGRPDLRISLHLPQESCSLITLADLDGDVQNIANELADDSSQDLTLVNASSTSGHTLHRHLPLLPQLDQDQRLTLTFSGARDTQEKDMPVA